MADSYIQISSNLVNQLTTDRSKSRKKTRKIKSKATQKPKETQDLVTPTLRPSKSSTSPEWPRQPPMYLPASTSPSPELNKKLEAIKSVLRDSANVLEKLEKQEATMSRELNQKAKELTDKEFKLPYQNPMPCVAEKDACLECYKKYAKNPLQCAEKVETFADCVRLSRRVPEI